MAGGQRTQAQVNADVAMTEAITAAAKAYDTMEPEELIMDYVVVAYSNSFELADERATRVIILYKDDQVLTYTVEGLLRSALRHHLRGMTNPDEEFGGDDDE